jgi:hypothetical protein
VQLQVPAGGCGKERRFVVRAKPELSRYPVAFGAHVHGENAAGRIKEHGASITPDQ